MKVLNPKPTFMGHRERLRQKLAKQGLDGFLPHEVLELLLTYAIPRKDTKPLAWALFKKFGSLAAVLDADEKQLREVEGIGPHTAQFLYLLHEVVKSYSLTQVKEATNLTSLHQVLAYCKASLANRRVECLEALCLSIRRTLISTHVLATGSLGSVMISPRQVVECALKTNAKAVILVHNHPSGDAHPSKEDIALTLQMVQAASYFDIKIEDHIIIGKGGNYFSFRAEGIIGNKKN